MQLFYEELGRELLWAPGGWRGTVFRERGCPGVWRRGREVFIWLVVCERGRRRGAERGRERGRGGREPKLTKWCMKKDATS